MQSQNGDVQLSVTLDTKGIKSDVQKLREEIQKGVNDNKATTIKIKPELDKQGVVNEAHETADVVRKEIEGITPVIKPEVDIPDTGGLDKLREELSTGVFSDETQAELDRIQGILDRKKEIAQATQEQASAEQQVVENVKSAADVYREAAETQARVQQQIEEMMSASAAQAGQTAEAEQRMSEELKEALVNIEGMKFELADTEMIAANMAFDLEEFAEGFKYSDDFNRLNQVAQDLTKEFNKGAQELLKMEYEGKENTEEFNQLALKTSEVGETLHEVLGSLNDMRDAGTGFTEGFDEATVKKVERAYDALTNKITLRREAERQAQQQAQQTGQTEVNTARETERAGMKGVSLFQKITSILKKLQPHLHRTHKSLGGIRLNFMNILGAAVGIRSLYALFSKLKTAVTEGVKNLVQWNGGNNELNKSISLLMNSLNQLKNALGAAFAPIVSMIAPALSTLINLVTQATNAVAQFVALISGATTWMRAKKLQDDYAKSLKKTGGAAKDAAGSLAAFDDIDVLNKNTSGGGGAGGADVGSLFEEVEIEPWIKDLLEKLKKMWENADFTELGALIGKKLKEALDNIPWDEIKQVAYKIGKSIATLINGFVEVEGLGYTLGKTFAEAINTAFSFLYGFVHNLHWDSIGKFIGEQFLGFVDYIDAELIGKTLGEALVGIIDLAFNTVKTIMEGNGFKKFGEKVGTIIKTIFDKMGDIDLKTGKNAWQKLGETMSDSIKGILTSIITALRTVQWEKVGQAIADFIGSIDWGGIIFDLIDLADAIIDAIVTAIFALHTSLSESHPLVTAIIDVLALAAALAAMHGISIATVTMTIGKVVIAAILAWELGINIGEELGKLLSPEDGSWYVDWSWDDILGDPQAALDGFKAWWDDIWANVSEAAYEIFFEPFEPNGELTLEGFFAGWDTYMETVGWLFTSNWVQELIKFVKGLFGIHSPSTVFEDIGKNVMKGMFNGISSMINAVVNLFTTLKTNIMTVIDDWKKKLEEAWTNIKKFATETWTEIKKTIEEKVTAFKTNAEEKITEFKTNVETFWSNLKKSTGETWDKIKEAIETPVKTFKENVEDLVKKFKDALVTHWTTLKTNTLEKWNQIKQGIINVFVAIKEGIKAPINGIISFVEGMVNSVIDGINFLIDKLNVLVDMANKLPGGGLDLGVLEHINHIEIPRLAQGAVIPPNREFLAMLGDQKYGTNIEAPLDTIKEAFADVVGNMQVESVGTSVMEVDGQTFARLMVPYVVSEMNRRGMNVKILEAT